MFLADYACQPNCSAGRLHPEVPAPTRSEFQRDRDRIVHSTAFRRLVYKTQVFLNHEGDLFRTRLTHSLEVAQLGRSIARNLQLNEDLVEAIALAHDVGHTPFGHAGQDALNDSLKANRPSSAGFEHNLQSLRVVDRLETSYPLHDGLNLTFETREGILKHCSRVNAARIEAKEPNGVAHRFLSADASPAGRRLQPSLEAQLVNLADEIAYNAHDIDDGVRSGLLTMEQLEEVELFNRFQRDALRAHPMLQGRKLLFDTIRRMLSAQVYDVTDDSRMSLQKAGPDSVGAVRRMPGLIHFSQEMAVQTQQLKRFLHQKLYRHPTVERTSQIAQSVVCDLFAAYIDDNRCMPVELCDATASAGVRISDRAVADYIAGMTDRFALKEHQRITGRVAFEV